MVYLTHEHHPRQTRESTSEESKQINYPLGMLCVSDDGRVGITHMFAIAYSHQHPVRCKAGVEYVCVGWSV